MFSAHIALAFLMMSGAAVAQTYVISTSGALPGGLALSAAGASGGSPIVYTLAGTGVAYHAKPVVRAAAVNRMSARVGAALRCFPPPPARARSHQLPAAQAYF